MINRTILALATSAMLLAACSDIAEDERLLEVEAAAVSRAVLIEDFTGQRCSNCPLASELIERLQSEYGKENVIAVGIHSEPLGFAGNARMAGLMTPDGRAYGQQWGVNSQPIGLVNRVDGLCDRSDWAKRVRDEIARPTDVKMGLSVECTDGTLAITTEVTALKDIAAKMQLWLVQDNIVAPQTMPDGTNKADYVHNHVFRAAINGAWGEDIAIADGKTATYSHTFLLDNSALPANQPPFVAEDCAVVAFVYDNSGVMQVVKAEIGK